MSPDLYGQVRHKFTQTNPLRDAREQIIFWQARSHNIPMAGICRGGQFLNVMCGGSMWQDVDGHALGDGVGHLAWDSRTKETFMVSSTHHQMMIPTQRAHLIVQAGCSSKKMKMRGGNEVYVYNQHPVDVEAVWYPEHNCFCFQPHPEFPSHEELAVRYFEYVDDLLFQQGKGWESKPEVKEK